MPAASQAPIDLLLPAHHCTGACITSGHVTFTLWLNQALQGGAAAAMTLGPLGCVGTGLASGA